jgi:hypothetical protein
LWFELVKREFDVRFDVQSVVRTSVEVLIVLVFTTVSEVRAVFIFRMTAR